MQVLRALADGGEHARQPHQVAAPRQLGTGMCQRGNRRQRIVQLVADDADHPLPRGHFLPRQLARHAPEQMQPMRPPLQPECPLRQVEGFLAAIHVDAEQRVLAAAHRVAQRPRRLRQQRREIQTVQAAAFVEQVSRGNVGVDDAPNRVGQHQRHRGVLHHGIQQQLALHQVLALFAQGLPQLVVHGDQATQFIPPVDGDGQAEIPIAIARHRPFQRPQQPVDR